MQLSEKEKMLIEDQKKHEKVCIKKYRQYAEAAQDSQLKQLFTAFADKEQEHYDTLNQILKDQTPSVQQTSPENQEQAQPKEQEMQGQYQEEAGTEHDGYLCEDMLMIEKYISGTYDTAIFECVDTQVRQVLNHIQKEEQQHGEEIFNYMQQKGLYQAQ